MLKALLVFVLCAAGAFGAEERLRGVLEKTARPDACAQITDALDDVYYIAKSDAAEKMIAPFVGRNIVVIVTGSAHPGRAGQEAVFDLKAVEKYTPPAKTP